MLPILEKFPVFLSLILGIYDQIFLPDYFSVRLNNFIHLFCKRIIFFNKISCFITFIKIRSRIFYITIYFISEKFCIKLIKLITETFKIKLLYSTDIAYNRNATTTHCLKQCKR